MSKFTPNQLKFIDWMARGKAFRDPSTEAEFANELDINPRTLTRWKKGQNGFTEQEFRSAVNSRARELLRHSTPEIFATLAKEAEEGNFQHMKLALEMIGEYQESTKQELSGDIRINVVYESDSNPS